MGKMFMAASNYLPTQVSDMMNQDRAFATGRLNFSGQRNICTLSTYVWPRPPTTRQNLVRVCLLRAQNPQTRAESQTRTEDGQEEG